MSRRALKLEIDLAGLTLKNPVIAAAGSFGYGSEPAAFVPAAELGALVTHPITRHPRPGGRPPRAVETRGGLLTGVGLAGIGLDRFVAEKAPMLAGLGTVVIASVAGSEPAEFAEVARRLDGISAISAVELQLGGPEGADGADFGTTAGGVKAVVSAVRAAVGRVKVFPKLPPDVTDITITARAAVDAGADGLSLIGAIPGMAIDPETRKPMLGEGTGGLAGPAVKPVALRMVHQVYRRVGKPAGVPIIGMGGVQFPSDAVEFLLAGATAVAVGTATFADPQATMRIASGLRTYLERHRLDDVSALTGALRTE